MFEPFANRRSAEAFDLASRLANKLNAHMARGDIVYDSEDKSVLPSSGHWKILPEAGEVSFQDGNCSWVLVGFEFHENGGVWATKKDVKASFDKFLVIDKAHCKKITHD